MSVRLVIADEVKALLPDGALHPNRELTAEWETRLTVDGPCLTCGRPLGDVRAVVLIRYRDGHMGLTEAHPEHASSGVLDEPAATATDECADGPAELAPAQPAGDLAYRLFERVAYPRATIIYEHPNIEAVPARLLIEMSLGMGFVVLENSFWTAAPLRAERIWLEIVSRSGRIVGDRSAVEVAGHELYFNGREGPTFDSILSPEWRQAAREDGEVLVLLAATPIGLAAELSPDRFLDLVDARVRARHLLGTALELREV